MGNRVLVPLFWLLLNPVWATSNQPLKHPAGDCVLNPLDQTKLQGFKHRHDRALQRIDSEGPSTCEVLKPSLEEQKCHKILAVAKALIEEALVHNTKLLACHNINKAAY